MKVTLPVIDRDRRAWLLPLLSGLVLSSIIYGRFLFGDGVLLYKDVGSDSVNIVYPYLVHLSDYLRSEGIPSWSFSAGMGQDLFYLAGGLIWQPVIWLPRELIASALLYQHLLKTLLAGFLFFRFLQLRGLTSPASLLGSLLLSFSAYLCMGGCWVNLADEVVGFTTILLAAELTLARGRWWLLSFAVMLIGLLSPFHLYLCALLLACYAPARLIVEHRGQPKVVLRKCVILAGAACLGVGLGTVVTLPHLYAILNSPRGSGTFAVSSLFVSQPIFGLASGLQGVTAILRPLANDAIGTANDFRGWTNYLEAPLTYCGLICLILLPQVFVGAPRRQRIIYVVFLAGIVLSNIFPWLRHLFWLFQGDYYRAHSLFSILGLIGFSMVAFSRYTEGRRLCLWLLAVTTILLAAIPYLPFTGVQTRVNPDLKLPIALLLLSYGLVLALGQRLKRQKLATVLVIGMTMIELVLFDRITVSDRNVVTKGELNARVGYNDETVDAVRDIKASDTDKFFRITKLRPSGPSVLNSLNDALVFGYYGTSSYSSFNNINYINFLAAVNATPINSETDTRWTDGLLTDPILSLFACEKYALTNDPLPFQRAVQYEFIRRYERDYLFRNARYLPFGLTFDHFITEEALLTVPADEKAGVVLQVAVLPGKDEAARRGLMEADASLLGEQGKQLSLAEVAATRRATALELTSFTQTRFAGKLRLDRKSILVFQTPFDRGWQAFQDGQAAAALKVDVGLLGVAVDAGEHKVEMRYRTPFLGLGLAISIASLSILLLSVWRWPRLGYGFVSR